MDIVCDIDNIQNTEFGVGRDHDDPTFNFIPTNRSVKDHLRIMVQNTVESLRSVSDDPTIYSPSERYGSIEHLYFPLENEEAEMYHTLARRSINLDADTLQDASNVFCYFAKFTDHMKRDLIALKRPNQFKSLGRTKVILRFVENYLTVLDDPLFRLDQDFDILIDSETIYILRPSGFEFMGKLQNAIKAAVPSNIESISKDMQFMNFEAIAQYASTHTRAARYLASIRTYDWAKNIDRASLLHLCAATGVTVTQGQGGKIDISDEQVLGFLEVLDRRRYEVALVSGSPEQFKASNRQAI